MDSTCPDPPDPTPEQIRQRAAAIRSKWSPIERAKRRYAATHHVRGKPSPEDLMDWLRWQPPVAPERQ
jgi:hypothetical protein